jgi:hypothetical protein
MKNPKVQDWFKIVRAISIIIIVNIIGIQLGLGIFPQTCLDIMLWFFI